MATFKKGDLLITVSGRPWLNEYQSQFCIVLARDKKFDSITVKFFFNEVIETYMNREHKLEDQFNKVGNKMHKNKYIGLFL